MDAAQFAPRHGQVAGHTCAAGQHDGLVTVAQVLVGDVVADVHAALELHAFAGHEVDALVDHPFLQLEVGYAVAQQSARPRVLLVDSHVVARPVEHLGGGQPRGTGTHHGHSLGPADSARLGRDVARGGSPAR